MWTKLTKTLSQAASSHCEKCKLCRYAEANPKTTAAGIIRWHQSWCPAYLAYKRQLKAIDAGR